MAVFLRDALLVSYLYEAWIELHGLRGVHYGIAECFSLQVRLHPSSQSRDQARQGKGCVGTTTHLSSVGEESWILVIQLDCF
jgi:hypothetical protein